MDAASKSAILTQFPAVYPILDADHLQSVGCDAVTMAEALGRSGARIAQYRHKQAYTRAAFEEAAEVGRVLRNAGICYIVNDRADIALAVGADGVHVGQDDLPPEEVRRLIGPDMLLGYSTHTASQLSAAQCNWADYLAIGPVFGTTTKQDPDPVVGAQGVREVRALTAMPLVAIGGITLANAGAVLDEGADSVSVISGISVANLPGWMALQR